jgi:decaprenylphospho-beta-D-ribofuranose 2-oxidase
MNYQPTLASGAVEYTVYAMFVLVFLNALGQGRRWVATLVFGTLTGLGAEYAISHREHARYVYDVKLFLLTPVEVPLCVALGWGMVFYVSTLTAQRMAANAATSGKSYMKSLVVSSLVAGALGVNIDLSLDVVAQAHHFWTWQTWKGDVPTVNTPDQLDTLMGVPYDNFLSWTIGIAVYGLIVRGLFHWVNRASQAKSQVMPGIASLKGSSSWFLDWLIPLVGGLVSAGFFFVLKVPLESVYRQVGETAAFAAIFFVALGFLCATIPRGSRSEEINWVVLGTVFYFHGISFLLLITHASDFKKLTPMLILIPMNLFAGLIGYAWPSLDAILDRFPGDPNARLPLIVRRTLASYGGDKVRALVSAPRSVDELQGLLAFAERTKRKVSFRAGGQAFDTQSLNQDLVISLEHFDKIEVDAAARTVTVGCGAKWGNILAATSEVGLVPHVMVTSSVASAGGTLSSNSLGRFSPSVGREGAHVASFTLLTLDNEVQVCTDDKQTPNYPLFLSVIGGLGYVGAVLEITYKLLPLPAKASVVKTTFSLVEGLKRTAGNVAPVKQRYEPLLVPFVDSVCSHRNACHGQPVGAVLAEAFSVAVNLRGSGWGLFARSTYEPAKSAETLPRSVFHSPQSVAHILLQIAANFPLLRSLGYWLTYRQYRGKSREFVDPLPGYTFFEDGNRRVRGALHAIGLPGRLVQQTFMIPCDVKDAPGSSERLLAFLGDADGLFTEMKIDPALIDVLYVGRDPHGFLLSSSRNMDAFAITFTFERLILPMNREVEAMKSLSRICLKLNGVVHLVKHVHAADDTIKDMYRAAFADMRAIRTTRNSQPVLANEFSARALPGI